ncbi:uncharacterized protein G2W53_004479 [Senna tora]|uniref:Uncharacterized protein n=1 Tax=Senna tora TaxID=362788 RepID=A0A834XDG0_9FABA|nr:uncharacterized protein G2W53_004479 [Senna tora]
MWMKYGVKSRTQNGGEGSLLVTTSKNDGAEQGVRLDNNERRELRTLSRGIG